MLKSTRITKYALLLICLITLFACGKGNPEPEDPKGPDGNPIENPDQDPDTEEPPKAVRLPLEIVYGKLTTTFSYYPKSTRLKEISKSTGYRYLFMYDESNRLFEYQAILDDKLLYFSQVAWDNDKVVKIIRFNVDQEFNQTYTPNGYFTVEYDTKNRLNKVQTFDNKKKLVAEKYLEYGENDKLLKVKAGNTVDDDIFDFSLDSNNSLFKNISFASLIYIMHDDIMFSTPNNILSYTSKQKSEEDRSISYVYNSDDYPIQMDVTRNKWKEKHLIKYQEATE